MPRIIKKNIDEIRTDWKITKMYSLLGISISFRLFLNRLKPVNPAQNKTNKITKNIKPIILFPYA